MTEHVLKDDIDVATHRSAKIFQVRIRIDHSSSDFCITTHDAIRLQNILANYDTTNSIRIASDQGHYEAMWLYKDGFCLKHYIAGLEFILSEECTCELHYLLGLAIATLSTSVASAFAGAAVAVKELSESVNKLPKDIFEDDEDGTKKRTNDNLRGVFG